MDEITDRQIEIERQTAGLRLLEDLLKSIERSSKLEEFIEKILENAVRFLNGQTVNLLLRLDSGWYRYGPGRDAVKIDISSGREYSEILMNKDSHVPSNSLYPLLDEASEVFGILEIGGAAPEQPRPADFSLFVRYCGIVLRNVITARLSMNRITDEFSQVFNSNIDGILQIDGELNVQRCNLKFYELAGLDPGFFEGRNLRDIEGTSELVGYISDVQHSGTDSGDKSISFTNRKTGDRQYCIISLSPLYRDDEEVCGYVLNMKDINRLKKTEAELRASEERLSIAFKGSTDGLWDWNINTDECYFSPRWKQIIGYEDDEIPNAFSEWERLTDKEGLDAAWAQLNEIMSGDKDYFECEFRMRHKEGHLVDILSRAYLMKDEEGKPLRLIGTHVDLSEIRRREEELRNAKEQAEESERLKSNFLANMSHEIRTPMNGIIGFSRLLSENGLDEETRKRYADIVNESCERLLNVVNDILDISQLESEQLVISEAEVELESFFKKIYVFFEKQAEKKSLSFRLELESGLPETAFFDSNRIFQVLTNLIDNSLKFTKKGEVRFGCSRAQEGVRFFVTDTGCGIPYEYQDKIFDRFYQRDASLTRSIGGNGLGLAICKRLVDLHGGELRLDSEPERGSEFYFILPPKQAVQS